MNDGHNGAVSRAFVARRTKIVAGGSVAINSLVTAATESSAKKMNGGPEFFNRRKCEGLVHRRLIQPM
jgi:hypothetical protein